MQIVERVLGLLETVSMPPQGKSLTEISQRLELPMPTAYRLLSALIDQHYVRRDDDSGWYFPGHALMRLASLPMGAADIVELAQPHLRELLVEFGETVFVAQMVDRRAICVASESSPRTLHVQVKTGRDLPLHASAAARALLAFRSDKEAAEVLADHEYEPFTPSTPRDARAVLEHLLEIRGRGYDICEDELDANVWAVAAPIVQSDGRALASLTVALPRERLRPATLRRSITDSVLRHAREITSQLPGHRLVS